jgi:hypothetical protein
LAVGVVLAPLWLGYRPVGGDPDRLFCPIKGELARAFQEGRLPFWSDRLGLGFPLLAESHAAALYPPNWVLYRALAVDDAYAVAMWGHTVGLAVVVAAYARRLGMGAGGAALASLAVSLSGFLSIHASHEWAYHGLFYGVLTLWAADGVATSGRLVWVAAVALASGMGWLVGHFQIQAWALPIVMIASAGRLTGRTGWAKLRRLAGVGLGIAWGGAIAAAQLALSWELARWTGSADRDRIFYGYPPAHAFELAWPSLFRAIAPEDGYWFALGTTGYEACLFVGIPALVLACVGAVGWRRPARVWVVLTAMSFALATMPSWWPAGYALVTHVPLLGLFRCPARWTAFTSLGLGLLAGFGWDETRSRRRWVAGVLGAVGFAGVGLLGRRLDPGVAASAVVWGLTLLLILVGRRDSRARPALLALAAGELGWWYYHATTVWGRGVELPAASPVLSRLSQEPTIGLVAGPLDDLPLRVGWGTAEPYVGFRLDPVNGLLRQVSERDQWLADPGLVDWLKRRGVTHRVVEGDGRAPPGVLLYDGADPALDRLARSPRPGKRWRLYRTGDRRPGAAWVQEVRLAATRPEALALAVRGITAVTAEAADLAGRRFAPGRIVDWDAGGGRVAHEGPGVVRLDRIAYPGWSYRVNGGSWQRPRELEGGLQGLVVEGAGQSRIDVRYEPTDWGWASGLSLGAGLLALGVVGLGLRRPVRSIPGPEAD